MDIDAGPQGQGANANLLKNSHKIDNDMSRHSMQKIPQIANISTNCNRQENMSDPKVIGYKKENSKNVGDPLASTSTSENREDLLVCFELRTDGCVMKTFSKNDVCGDKNSDPGNDHIVPSTSNNSPPQNRNHTNNSLGSHTGNKTNNNEKPESSAGILDTREEVHSADTPREIGTKSPEILLDEVQEEVTRLNISTEESKSSEPATETPSVVVINKQTDSLKSLLAYDGDSDSERSDTELREKPNDTKKTKAAKSTEKNWRKAKEDVSGTSDSESDSSASTLSSESESDSENSDGEFNNSDGDSASVIDASDDGIRTESPVLNKTNHKGAVKKTNRAGGYFPEYLPPIPDLTKLNINAEEEFMHIGKINAIIAELASINILVTIEALPGTPAFDLDSMLFMDDQTGKKPIGPIFDVLGPVSEPMYCIRFNNEDEIKKLGIKSGMKIYAAPKSEEFTKFVFVKELLKMKGTDASWLNDQEQPSEVAEFSDDEQERQARRSDKMNTKRKLEDSSLERHRRYEKTMNQCNTLNTRVCKLMDAHRNMSKQIRPSPKDELPAVLEPPDCLLLPAVPPEFNPTVPPPGFGHPSPYGFPPQSTLFAPSPPAFGQPPNFPSYSSQSAAFGAHAVFSAPTHFGSFYANQPSAPNSLGPPPARWQQCDNFRRGRYNQRSGHRQNSDNYYTNNSRNFRGAGPSSQPF